MGNRKEKPHVSPSQLDMYEKCGEQWRRRYVLKEKIPPGIAMLRGSSVHVGAEINFKQKIETHQDLPTKDIVEASVESFDSNSRNGVSFTEEEMRIGTKKVVGKEKDVVAKSAQVLGDEVVKHYQPAFVEKLHRISLSKERDLVVKLDVATVKDEIMDVKTGRRMSEADARQSVQMNIYGIAYHGITGKTPQSLIHENLVAPLTPTGEVKRNPLRTSLRPQNVDATIRRLNSFLTGLEAGFFKPAPQGAWWCSTKYCGYAWTCPFYLSGESGVKEQDKKGG